MTVQERGSWLSLDLSDHLVYRGPRAVSFYQQHILVVSQDLAALSKGKFIKSFSDKLVKPDLFLKKCVL